MRSRLRPRRCSTFSAALNQLQPGDDRLLLRRKPASLRRGCGKFACRFDIDLYLRDKVNEPALNCDLAEPPQMGDPGIKLGYPRLYSVHAAHKSSSRCAR